MPRVNSPQQLAFVEPERNAVVRLTGAWFPCGFLTSKHGSESIEVSDEPAIQWLVQRIQPCLMCEQLADGYALLTLLRELRPIRAHALFVVEPAARVGEGKCHGGQSLSGRVHDYHRA